MQLDLGSSFWGMAFILASTNLLTARIAAGCFIVALVVVLFIAKNVRQLKMQIYKLFFLPNLSCFWADFYLFWVSCSLDEKSGHFEDFVLVGIL